MHRMNHTTTVLLVLALCGGYARGDEPMAYRFKDGQSVASVSFELNSNKIFLPVRINGGEQRWFILDSGCPVTAVDMEVAKKLGLPIKGEREIGGAGEGQTAVGNTKVESLQLA